MLREIALFGALAPSLLLYFLASILLFVIVDRLITRVGAYRLVWHPPLVRLGLFLALPPRIHHKTLRPLMIKAILRVIATVLVVAAGSAGAYELWDYYMLSPWTRDAKVVADVVTMAPDVAGFVTDLRVKDNQFVHKGVSLRRRSGTLQACARDGGSECGGRQGVDAVGPGDARRRAKLTTLSITDEDKENSQHQADLATATYGQAIADRDMARLNLERTTVRAPVNGYITNLTLVVGQYAAVGTQLMALIDSDFYRVQGYFEETKMPAIKMGAPVTIYLMSGTPALQGHVVGISRGITGSGGSGRARTAGETSTRPSSGSGSRSESLCASTSTRFLTAYRSAQA